MSSINGVMLLPLDAASYRHHTAHHTFLAKVSSGSKTPDPRLDLTRAVEDRVRQEMQRHFQATPFRVLRWEQRRPDGRAVVKFCELDGVYRAPYRTNVLLEVKASASASSLKSGLAQLRSAVSTASRVHANTVGLLVVADLGEWSDLFSKAPVHPLPGYFSRMELDFLDWPPCLPAGKTSGICVAVVPGSTVREWLPDELPQECDSPTVSGSSDRLPSTLATGFFAMAGARLHGVGVHTTAKAGI